MKEMEENMKTGKMILMKILIMMMMVILVDTGCAKTEHADPNIDHWTCSMHPQVNKPGPGACPICGMDLVPVYKQGSSLMPGIEITPERQQLIGVKKAVVAQKRVHKPIRTFGRIAYDPSLAVAQKEYLEAWRGRSSLLSATRSKLKVLGMSDDEINELPSKRKDGSGLYLPGPQDAIWVYATLFESDLPYVKVGNDVEVTLPSLPGKKYEGVVRSIDPVVDSVTRTLRARIELAQADGSLKPDQTADAVIHADLGEHMTIPASALFDGGRHQWVYVYHENDEAFATTIQKLDLLVRWNLIGHGNHRFERRQIKVGAVAGGDVMILKGLKEGEVVVNDALFFVDSESQLKDVTAMAPVHVH